MRPLRLSSSQRFSLFNQLRSVLISDETDRMNPNPNHSLITLTRTSNHYCQYATEGQQLTITGKNTDKIKRKGKVHSIPVIQDLNPSFILSESC